MNCLFSDGEGVRMSIDRLNQVDSSSGQECLPGDLRIHCTVKKNAARSDFASTDDYAQALKVSPYSTKYKNM